MLSEMVWEPMSSTNAEDNDETSELRIAYDLRELAAWIDASWDHEQPAVAPQDLLEAVPALSRPLSFDRSGSIDSIFSTSSSSSSSSTYSLDDAPDQLDDLEAFALLHSGGAANKKAWTAEEDAIIAEGVAQFGNKWSRIRKMLPESSASRTEDSVRNRWQRLQRKQSRRAAKAGRVGLAPGG